MTFLPDLRDLAINRRAHPRVSALRQVFWNAVAFGATAFAVSVAVFGAYRIFF
jgi:hypothetical protein